MINVPVEVKDALREGRLKKNYRMVVLNDDGTEDFTIDNDNLVKESVSIDERMCSGDTIKFGLCEGSSLEFQYFNHPNITDRQVKVFCDVEYGASEPYTIPMGFFTVKKCSRQASTGIIKVTAYNKLQSDYLDAKANTEISTLAADGCEDDKISVDTITTALLDGYGVEKKKSGIEYEVTAHASWSQYFSVQLLDRSGTFYFSYDTSGSSAELEGGYTRKIVEVDGAAKYSSYAQRAMNSLKAWIIDNIKNGESFWESSIKTACLVWLFPVMFELSYYGQKKTCIYIPEEYITSNTISYGGDTYYVRSLDTLYRLNKPLGGNVSLPNISMWFQIWSNAYIHTQNTAQSELIKEWHFEEKDDFDDYLPTFWEVEEAISDIGTIEISNNNLPDVTLRELQSASYETLCQFGQLSRTTDLFSGVELNHSRLLPADSLYPDNALYPDGAQESAFRSQYSKLWADEGNIHKWRYLIITYKGLDGEGNEADFTLQRTINNDGTDDYNCSDNWLFRNLVWTEAQIGTYADAMKAKMQDITWFPFEMWCAGLPYLETGDEIEIPLGNQTYTSYILQRQLKGIQNLQDTYINGTLDIF